LDEINGLIWSSVKWRDYLWYIAHKMIRQYIFWGVNYNIVLVVYQNEIINPYSIKNS
jgi:hypothetical protein